MKFGRSGGKGRRKRRARSQTRIRPLAAFRDLTREVGYAAESGGTIHIALGSGGLTGEDAVMSLAGLELVEALADAVVLYDAPPIITVGDATLLPLAQDIVRRAYERYDRIDRYDPNLIRFVGPTPIAYAAGVASMVTTEEVSANVIVGSFGAEVSLITDAGTRHGLPQIAAAATSGAMGAMYPAAEHLAIGEDLYTAGAQVTGKRRFLVSLIAQDSLRLFLVVIVLLVAASTFLSSI